MAAAFENSPDVLLDYVIENTQTSELGQFLLTADTNGDRTVFSLLTSAKAANSYSFGESGLKKLDIYVSFIRQIFSAINFPNWQPDSLFESTFIGGLMMDLATVWRHLFEDSPTRFISSTVEQVQRVLQQKRLLQEELGRFTPLNQEHNAERYHEPQKVVNMYKKEKPEFLKQLQTGLDKSAFDLDIMLRRACLRIFADAWFD